MCLVKVNSAKKATVKVTVGTPATSVSLNKTSATILKGNTLTLTATVSPSSTVSNKNVVWSSTNTAVATVSSTGKVTAKAAGTATIKAVAADGSGKYKLCKITVDGKNSISATKVVNPYVVKVALKYAQTLPDSYFAVKYKNDAASSYVEKVEIANVETTNNKDYYITLKEGLDEFCYVQSLVKGLKGTSGYVAKDILYDPYGKNTTLKNGDYIYTYSVGDTISITPFSILGVADISVKYLPTGLKSSTTYTSSYSSGTATTLYIKGTATKAGVYNIKYTGKDQKGLTYTGVVKILIGDDNTIASDVCDVYDITSDEDVYCISKKISVTGGSGSYTYEILDNKYNFKTSSAGYIFGYIDEPGTYTIKYKVTDANNSQISTTAAFKINLAKSRRIIVTVKDSNGLIIDDADILVLNKKVNTNYTRYSYPYFSTYVGTYQSYVSIGTYDIMVVYEDSMKVLLSKAITKDTNKFVVVLEDVDLTKEE